nr:aldo/keto reductase [Bifidobacterium catenulatum]
MMMNGELAGFTIPRLGMGTMALAIEGRPDRDTAIRTIHAGLDAGVRYLDTAWSYYLPSEPGTGTAEDFGYGEKLVRDALASWNGPRDEVLVATKTGYRRTMEVPAFVAHVSDSGESDKQGAGFGVQMSDSPESDTQGWDSEGCGRRPGEERQHLQAAGSQYGWMADSRPETMIRDAKESALHLGVDTLDLLYSHGPDPEVAYEDQVGALKQLLDEGVIRYAGISRVDNAQIDTARKILGDKLIAVQNQFSPSHPDPEHTMEHCKELGLAFVCWSPLGGFLDAFDQRAYDPFREVAGNHGCSYQRVVLAWELTRYERLFTIPSARNPQEINDSFAAAELMLTPDELAMLNASVDARRG